MKRNLRKARRVGALQRLENNRKDMQHMQWKELDDTKDKERKHSLAKNLARMDSEIATLQSRIGGVL